MMPSIHRSKRLSVAAFVVTAAGLTRAFSPRPLPQRLGGFATLHYNNRQNQRTMNNYQMFAAQKNKDDNTDGWFSSILSNNTAESAIEASSSSKKTQSSNNKYDLVGVAQEFLDEQTGGWALSYADLSPDSPETVAGRAFLATNAAYLSAGLCLQFYTGDVILGIITDFCAAASLHYHYQQLVASNGSPQANEAVRYALLLDYIFAFSAIGLATLDLFQTTGGAALDYVVSSQANVDQVAWLISACIPAVTTAVAAVGFLSLSWKYEYGKPYMLWHSLWHLASAYAGFLIGDLHQQANQFIA